MNSLNNDLIIIKGNNISKSYKSGDEQLEIYNNYDIEVKSGEIIALIGPSGCGKSTLLNILSGIDRPDSGSVLFNDKNIFDMSDKEISRVRLNNFGFIFQDYQLLSTLSVIDNILIPVLAAKKQYDIEDIIQLCDNLGLKDRIYHYPHQLSGGEKQRVAIARALVNKPSVIFSDEATGNLDHTNSILVMNMLVECCKTYGSSLIYVTHDYELTHYADRVLHINMGD